MAIIRVKPGLALASDGTYPELRGNRKGGAMTADLSARYEESVIRGNTFFAANTANQALSVVSGTYTGLVVANPAGSLKNLVIIDVQFAIDAATTGVGAIVIGTAPTVALTTGNSTGPTGSPCFVGSGFSSIAKVGASCTFAAAPTIMRALAGSLWVTANATVVIAPIKDEIAGLITLAPGQAVCIEAVTTAVTGLGSITWEEVPV